MKVLLIVCAAFVATTALPQWPPRPMSDDMISYINKLGDTWVAGPSFEYIPEPDRLAYVKRLCGQILPVPMSMKPPMKQITPMKDLPDTFDARQKWTTCKSLNEVRDQSNCGSCWAFAAVESMTDRICILSNGKQNFHISAEDVLSCCWTCGNGCDGGFSSGAWDYFNRTGIVTGGQYGTHEGCQPYSLAHCDHHTTGKYNPCTGDSRTPKCHHTCEDGYNIPFEKDKHHGVSSYSVPRAEEAIMTEIYTKGPVSAGFTVYADFPQYKSGVYRHRTGGVLGGHAVKIMGWGVEDGSKYWLIANSWNEDWGLAGFFKILRGVDECGIESEITAGEPQV